ncbi:hypothetical protein Cha6605_0029 [Chamaesiphon minutus PCC 6605]|uniref:Uncharacterized protein n=2 Tax=Chamaesiphon TaxID=217161 RepID=K9U8F0_CHAP6|nr:hypothetical protein Cha6605_0029 [Chamaesiphon minutus PCC 6605]
MLQQSIDVKQATNIKTDSLIICRGIPLWVPCYYVADLSGYPLVGALLVRSQDDSTIEFYRFNQMSEERLERIENQLSQVIQAVGVMQQNMMAMQQNMTAMQNRMDSMEGTLLTTMTGGFNSLQNYIIDLDTDLAQNERKTEDNARNNRRLNQRLMRLENRNDDF